MARTPAEDLVRDYLSRLSAATRGELDAADKRALLDRTREFIEQQAGLSGRPDPMDVARLLARLGDPSSLVRDERQRLAELRGQELDASQHSRGNVGRALRRDARALGATWHWPTQEGEPQLRLTLLEGVEEPSGEVRGGDGSVGGGGRSAASEVLAAEAAPVSARPAPWPQHPQQVPVQPDDPEARRRTAPGSSDADPVLTDTVLTDTVLTGTVVNGRTHPGTAAPGAAASGATASDTAAGDSPDFGSPDFGSPDLGSSDFDSSVFDRSGFDDPAADDAGLDPPTFDRPGFDRPGFDDGGFEGPGFDDAHFDSAGFDDAEYEIPASDSADDDGAPPGDWEKPRAGGWLLKEIARRAKIVDRAESGRKPAFGELTERLAGSAYRFVRSLPQRWRRHPIEMTALLLLGPGGLVFPPLWVLGALVALASKLWHPLDKWAGLATPVLVTSLAAVLGVILAGSTHLGQDVHEGWVFAVDASRLSALGSAWYLARRARLGRRPSPVPPWKQGPKAS
jgi:hypothetical protein